jgi:uncharacterized membrane protein
LKFPEQDMPAITTPEPARPSKESHWRVALRGLAAAGFVIAGVLHFVYPAKYQSIIPPGFPSPTALVAISGVAEIAGGLGLLIPPLRRAAQWGLIALLLAVFPANVYMAIHPERIPDLHVSHWLLWARLPLQGVLMLWVKLCWRPHDAMQEKAAHF